MSKERQSILDRRTFLAAGLGTVAGFLVGRYGEAIGKSPEESLLYFPETRHTVKPPFLDFFKKYGPEVIGYPISEPTPENSKQYFQNLIVEWGKVDYYDYISGRPKTNGNPQFFVYPLGWTVFFKEKHPDALINDLPPAIGEYVLDESFRKFYEEHGGVEILGYPVADPSTIGTNARMQFLTNSALLCSLYTGKVIVSCLGEYFYQVKMSQTEKNQPWFQPVAKKE